MQHLSVFLRDKVSGSSLPQCAVFAKKISFFFKTTIYIVDSEKQELSCHLNVYLSLKYFGVR